MFSATFDTPADFYDRFNVDVGNYAAPGVRISEAFERWPGYDGPKVVHGDHDMSCGAPTTSRTLDPDSPDRSQWFWWCAPGGDPAKGHVMTAYDSSQYVVVAFSPKQSFTDVTKVCWDINATDEGGGKWTNMVMVPEALYQRFAPRLDYVAADSNADGGPGDFNIQQSDHPGVEVFGVRDFRGTQELYSGARILWQDRTEIHTADKAARYQHCLERLSATQARLSVERPNGSTSAWTLPAADWPTGPVRVVFQDEMYDPPKRGGYSERNVTWHWDNIEISTGG